LIFRINFPLFKGDRYYILFLAKQELQYRILQEKPGKKGYKLRHLPKDHPWRRLNQKITVDKQRSFFAAALG